MANEINSKFIKVSPGTTRIQGDGGAYIGIDETNNIFIGVPSETSQSMASVDADTSPSFFGIISDENTPNIQSITVFPSNNFHTINFNQTSIDTSYTTPLITEENSPSSVVNATESIQLNTISNVTESILQSPELILNEELFLPDIEAELFNLYNTGSILEDYYIGISDEEQRQISQALRNPTEIGPIGNISVRSKRRLPTKPSEVNPPPVWGKLMKLNYEKALNNINSFPSLNKYSKGLKVIAAITATQEGWNLPSSTQHLLHNPGNLRGGGDLGKKNIGDLGLFANFSTYDKGWTAMMNSIIQLFNGNDVRLNYDTGTKWINWFIDKDNNWYKDNNIPYKPISKSMPNYSSKNGNPPTFRQFYNIYAPWSDGNNPTTYAGNVAYTLGIALNKKVNVDDTILNYTK